MEFGGKGCNQCVASKKLGAKALLVARIGDDAFGKQYFNKIESYGLETDYVKFTEGVSTGMAQITVSESGQNTIVIVLGANEELSEKDVIEASKPIAQCNVLICQLEVPESTTLRALQIKNEAKKGRSILNAAPARSDLNPLIFLLPDIFCVNEVEAEVITGIKVTNRKKAEAAVAALIRKGCKEVILTLGKEGAMYGQTGNTKFTTVPSLSVNAIDTTGAGDAFIGALAFYFSAYPDLPVECIIKKANNVAAFSVQRRGTQESYPFSAEVTEKNSSGE